MYNRYYPYLYNRSEQHMPPHPPAVQKPSSKPPKKKLDLKCIKKDTYKSLNDVEYFLNNFTSSLKYIKLIKLLK